MSKTLQKNLKAKLAALDGPDWDSSDGETEQTQRLQKSSKTKSSSLNSKTKMNKKSENHTEPVSNVIYLGHLPDSFEEEELFQFFSQFGTVTHIHLSRSKRTGISRRYAFLRFADTEVASIVANTMSGYLMMGTQRLVSHTVLPDKIHPDLFKGGTRRISKSGKKLLNDKSRWKAVAATAAAAGKAIPNRALYASDNILARRREVFRLEVNKKKTAEKMKKITNKLISRESKKRDRLKALGIDYDFPGYAAGIAASEENNGNEIAGKSDDNDMLETNREKDAKKRKTTTIGDTVVESISPHKKKVEILNKNENKKSEISNKTPATSSLATTPKSEQKKRKGSKTSLDSTNPITQSDKKEKRKTKKNVKKKMDETDALENKDLKIQTPSSKKKKTSEDFLMTKTPSKVRAEMTTPISKDPRSSKRKSKVAPKSEDNMHANTREETSFKESYTPSKIRDAMRTPTKNTTSTDVIKMTTPPKSLPMSVPQTEIKKTKKKKNKRRKSVM